MAQYLNNIQNQIGKGNATARASDDINLQHRCVSQTRQITYSDVFFAFDSVLSFPVLPERIKGM